ncbi:MAG: hypothetical protein JW941_06580, partial [Candidatus Coatesbacteria bacterium]|nr:hypothetical protein [Candidatus Coatesbacteria bacterium]
MYDSIESQFEKGEAKRMKTIHLTLVILLLAIAATSGPAATYHVKQDGAGDFTYIQDAIDASVDGDTVIVHPGTYYENIQFGGKNITLSSTDPDDWDVVEAAVIDGGQNGSVVTFAGTEDASCELSGFTITNGSAENGGGIRCSESSPTIRNNEIISNSALSGGGIYIESGSPAILTNRIKFNHSHHSWRESGGGLFCRGTSHDTIIADGNSFIENASEGLGGAMLIGDVNAIIQNNVINGNQADAGGGGIWISDGGNARVSNNLIVLNEVIWGHGGGLQCGIGVTVDNCTFVDNLVTPTYGYGGAIYAYVWPDEINVKDCIFRGHEWPPAENCLVTSSCFGDPLFASDPLGEYYLDPDSPCVDAGSMSAAEAGLSDRTTQVDGTPDTGVVDMGYHYPISEDEVNVEVSCSLNADEFAPGDVLQGFVGVENRGVDVEVDIYAAFMLPDGTMISYTLSGFVDGAWPWYSDLILPSGFTVGQTEIFELVVPANAEPGSYSYLAAVCRAGEGQA